MYSVIRTKSAVVETVSLPGNRLFSPRAHTLCFCQPRLFPKPVRACLCPPPLPAQELSVPLDWPCRAADNQAAKGTCRAATPRNVSSCGWKRTKEPGGGRLLTLRSSTCPPSDSSKFCIIQCGRNTCYVREGGVRVVIRSYPSLYRS